MVRLVKVYHWSTHSHSHHKATDELYDRMNEKMDRFVEVLMGKDAKRVVEWNRHMELMHGDDGLGPPQQDKNHNNKQSFLKYIHTFREFLLNFDRCMDPAQDSDLLNIRDDLMGDVNQFLYMYSLH